MKSKYFDIKELVSRKVYNKYGEKSWGFINPKIIQFLDTLREELGKPITVNDWMFKGELQQRGLRANKDPMVMSKNDYYISQHCLGNAVDFNVKGMSADAVYNHIIDNYSSIYYRYITRIEDKKSTPTWTHVDCSNTQSNGLVVFKP